MLNGVKKLQEKQACIQFNNKNTKQHTETYT